MFIILSLVPSAILYTILCLCAKVKKDSFRFLLKIIGLGMLSALVSAGASLLFDEVIFGSFDHESVIYLFFDNFIFVALVEELCKFFAAKIPTWKNAAFNKTFNAVIYVMSAAFGFAVIENIVYMIFDSSLKQAIIRGLLGAFGHMVDAVFMAYFYGKAKYADANGESAQVKVYLRNALLIPILLHGAFDFILGQVDKSDLILLLFFVVYIAEIVFAVKYLKKALKENVPIPVTDARAENDQADQAEM